MLHFCNYIFKYGCGITCQVQIGCPWRKTYFNLFGAPNSLNYHIGFTTESIEDTTFAELGHVKVALDSIWSNKDLPMGLQYMLHPGTTDIHDDKFVPLLSSPKRACL